MATLFNISTYNDEHANNHIENLVLFFKNHLWLRIRYGRC